MPRWKHTDAREKASSPSVVQRLRYGLCQRTEYIRLLHQMKLSKESRYAIEGLMVLAKTKFGVPMQLRHIAAAAGVPASFLAKIFQKLHRANVLTSSRGAVRGYALARHPNAIKMSDVFTAVEGGDVLDRCIFWSARCADRSPCPMHFKWRRMRQAIVGLMQKTTLADLAIRERNNVYQSRKRSYGGASQ